MRLLVYLGHPAHFHLFHNVIHTLRERGHVIQIAIKKKDVLDALLKSTGWEYYNIFDANRGQSKAAIAWALLKRDARLLRLVKKFSPELMVGTSAEITHVGRVMAIPSIVVNEDDVDVVPHFARLAYPFASTLLAPRVCRMGRWEVKTVKYDGYHELAYLHPNHFTPDPSIKTTLGVGDDTFFLLRFAKLNAHHDAGVKGIDSTVARTLVEILKPHGRVFITAEREIERDLEAYRIGIDVSQIHNVLQFARLYVGDSQTMAAEAAVLGTPAIRFNDFVGRISYLEELEHVYELTYGIPTSRPRELYQRVATLVAQPELKNVWQERRVRMLSDKIDFASFLVDFLEQYLVRRSSTKGHPLN